MWGAFLNRVDRGKLRLPKVNCQSASGFPVLNWQAVAVHDHPVLPFPHSRSALALLPQISYSHLSDMPIFHPYILALLETRSPQIA